MPAPGEGDYRVAWVQAFHFSALNHLLVSLHLLVSGYIIHAGNGIRQFNEAVAMALLCSHRGIDVFRRFEQEPERFDTHKALTLVNKKANRRLLDVNPDGWSTLQRINDFYNKYSHTSALGVASVHMIGGGGVVLGTQFDPAKVEMYALELRLRMSALAPLGDVISRTSEIVAEGRNESSA